jgi:hypothetical protein
VTMAVVTPVVAAGDIHTLPVNKQKPSPHRDEGFCALRGEEPTAHSPQDCFLRRPCIAQPVSHTKREVGAELEAKRARLACEAEDPRSPGFG